MIPGEKFKLDKPSIGLVANRTRQVLIPAESIIEIVSTPTDRRRIVDVLWDGQPLTMFVDDLDVPGTEIAEPQHLSLVARA